MTVKGDFPESFGEVERSATPILTDFPVGMMNELGYPT